MPAPKRRRFVPPEVCPVCGEDVPRDARACPECGADERSGWRPDADAYLDGVDLPDDNDGNGRGDFDYDQFVRDEFGGGGGKGNVRPANVPWGWWVAGVILFLALAWGLFAGVWR